MVRTYRWHKKRADSEICEGVCVLHLNLHVSIHLLSLVWPVLTAFHLYNTSIIGYYYMCNSLTNYTRWNVKQVGAGELNMYRSATQQYLSNKQVPSFQVLIESLINAILELGTQLLKCVSPFLLIKCTLKLNFAMLDKSCLNTNATKWREKKNKSHKVKM